MPISFKHEIVGKTLKVYTSGKDDSLEDAINYTLAIIDIAKKQECTKIYCDERQLEYAISIIDTYQLAKKAAEEVKGLRKIAIVCDEKFLDDGKFYETVARNRGLIVFVTTDNEEALEWLG